MPTRHAQIARNSAAALAGRIGAIVLALVLAAGLFRLLGGAQYGAWSLVAVVLTAATILDFGLAGAVERETASARAQDDARYAGSIVTTALAIVAAAALVPQAVVLLWRPAFTGFTAEIWQGARVLPAAFGVALASAVLGAALTGLHRFNAAHAWRVAGLAAGTAGVLALAAAGVTRLDVLVTAYAAGSAITCAGSIAALRAAWPEMPLPGEIHRRSWQQLLTLGGPLQAASIGPLVADYAFRLIVARRFGPAGAGLYDLGARVAIALRSLAAAMLSAIVPHAVGLFAASAREEIRDLHRLAVQVTALAVLPGTALLVFLASDVAALLVPPGDDPALLASIIVRLALAYAASALILPGLLMARAAARPWPEAAGATAASAAGVASAILLPSLPAAALGFWSAYAVLLGAAWWRLSRQLGFPGLVDRTVAGIAGVTAAAWIAAVAIERAVAFLPGRLPAATAAVAGGVVFFVLLRRSFSGRHDAGVGAGFGRLLGSRGARRGTLAAGPAEAGPYDRLPRLHRGSSAAGARDAAAPLRVLCFVAAPEPSPGARYRVVQYLPALARMGIACDVMAAVGPATARRSVHGAGAAPWRRAGHWLRLFVETQWACARVIFQAPAYDRLLIYRVAIPWWAAGLLRHRRRDLVYDFDDALDAAEGGTWIERVRARYLARSLRRAARLCAVVTTSNARNAAVVRAAGGTAVVIPTSVPVERYTPRDGHTRTGPLVLGWIGTPSTATYLAAIEGALAEVLRARPGTIVRLVGSGRNPFTRLPCDIVEWRETNESDEVARFDIGLMPMPDTPWTRGKAALKALQYGAAGIPTVASWTPTNEAILQPGGGVRLCRTGGDWVTAILALIDDPAMRAQMGRASRQDVERTYSVEANAPRLAAVLEGEKSEVRST